MSERDKRYVENLQVHIEKAESIKRYSIERFDILIISLSSGGLALSSGFYKDFPAADKTFINIAWTSFSVALLINLTSQITGYYANKFDIKCTKQEIESVEETLEKDERKKFDDLKNLFNQLTKILNFISFLSLFAGIIFLILFITTAL